MKWRPAPVVLHERPQMVRRGRKVFEVYSDGFEQEIHHLVAKCYCMDLVDALTGIMVEERQPPDDL